MPSHSFPLYIPSNSCQFHTLHHTDRSLFCALVFPFLSVYPQFPSVPICSCLFLSTPVYPSLSLSISVYFCLSLFIPVYPCLFLSIAVYSCLSLFIPVYPCLFLSIPVYPYLTLFIPVYPCLFLSIPVYPCLSLFIPVYPCLSLSIPVYPCLSLSIPEVTSYFCPIYLCLYNSPLCSISISPVILPSIEEGPVTHVLVVDTTIVYSQLYSMYVL